MMFREKNNHLNTKLSIDVEINTVESKFIGNINGNYGDNKSKCKEINR